MKCENCLNEDCTEDQCANDCAVCSNCGNCQKNESTSIYPALSPSVSVANATIIGSPVIKPSFSTPMYEQIQLDLDKVTTVEDCVKIFKLLAGVHFHSASRYATFSVRAQTIPEYENLLRDEEVDESKIRQVDNPFV